MRLLSSSSRLVHIAAASTAAPLLAALLTACGGGGTDAASTAGAQASVAPLPEAVNASVPDATAAARRNTTPTPAPAPTPTPTGADCGIAGFQAAVLGRVNQWRAAGASCRTAGSFAPTTPLVWNARLQQSAVGHSQDMVAHNFFSHTSYDGRTMADRINATGYAWLGIGENIAAGYPTVIAVVDGWMASDGHCRNLMNPSYRDVGVACVPGNSANAYKTYWTMDLGKPG